MKTLTYNLKNVLTENYGKLSLLVFASGIAYLLINALDFANKLVK